MLDNRVIRFCTVQNYNGICSWFLLIGSILFAIRLIHFFYIRTK